ncbi:hypothetical protein [Chitinasiproducens palmae]|uniref:Uncharacterized protein n=1 Tax=Chitinasiproducens palmae TaxID=1770053 RepID=A0A1H2PQS0_9BURK|nr:hypothetical protein [Chitinasiproducens palmae]SDV49197.1 hypothetical protein SAMN05216551_107145 [Chitinasiproducens palmae]
MNKRLFLRFPLLSPEGDAGGGGGDAAAAAPAADGQTNAAAPAGDAAQNPAPTFADSLGDDADLKQWATDRGFKSPAEMAKAMRETEGKFAKPETADAYELPVPEGQDKAFSKEASGWFHDLGVPKDMAQAIAGKFNEYATAQQQQAALAEQQEGERQLGELKKEWGGQYDANVERGRQALQTFGIPADVVAKLEKQVGAAQIIKTFSKIGGALSEGTLHPGGAGGGGGEGQPADPEQARARRWYGDSMKK